MRKTFVLATALLCGQGISAQAAEVIWQGDMFVTVANAACESGGIVVGSFYRAVFKPRNLEDNPADTRLAMFGSRQALHHNWTGANYGNGPVDGIVIGSKGNAGSVSSTFSQALIQPATLTATTKTVTVKGRITNFFAVSGCTATLIGSLGNRPD